VPSPIAHSLIGLAVGVAALRPRGEPAGVTVRSRALPLLVFAVLANAPDLDFVPGLLAGDLNRYHHGPSHSLLWALGFALWAALLARWRGVRLSRAGWAAAAAAVLSHLVADVFCQDRSPPFGIPLWWPVSGDPVHAPWPVFAAMEKTDLAAIFSMANLLPALREMAIGGAFLAVAWAWTSRQPRAAAAPGAGP
jgi:inner membrane protein